MTAALAPFFRIPGLLRAEAVEDYLASQGIQIWSADFPADDWRHISSSRVYDLAIKRLEAKGKGILLLHDIQARTVAALPRILHELKARGYRIVHVVPATPERPATPTEPQQWQLHPPSETVAISHWPKIPNFVFADADMLPAPSLSDLDWRDAESMAPGAVRSRQTACARRSAAAASALAPAIAARAGQRRHRPARAGAEHFRDRGKSARDSAVAASVLASCGANVPAGWQSGRLLKADRGRRRRPAHDPRQAPISDRPGGAARCRPRAHRQRCPAGHAEAFGSGQEKKRVTVQSVTIFETHSSTTKARNNRSI